MKSGDAKPIPEYLAKRRIPSNEMQGPLKEMTRMRLETDVCYRGT